MASDAPTPENNLILRQMNGMRRDMVAVSETNARVVELLGRMNMRLDEMSERFDGAFSRIDRRIQDLHGDVILMENRVLDAITEVRNLRIRIDEDRPEAAFAGPADSRS
ncbi:MULTISPECIES: hypothetical protein [unclassified Methylobacterium]|jgi:hypothetical protein|uniref:hypothetical protein n=1 Tax=unclassified Methylobacterium TaxID=2615210 RepID=UPI00135616E3|nr:hypothetical protein [Methylobacterium sp. 2A]MWV23608.1 hypothetical protein [Methylobacterium sp. 2A]